MKSLATKHPKSSNPVSKRTQVTRSTVSGRFVIGADAPSLSAKAKEQVDHKRPSKRAAKLAATAEKANVRCSSIA